MVSDHPDSLVDVRVHNGIKMSKSSSWSEALGCCLSDRDQLIYGHPIERISIGDLLSEESIYDMVAVSVDVPGSSRMISSNSKKERSRKVHSVQMHLLSVLISSENAVINPRRYGQIAGCCAESNMLESSIDVLVSLHCGLENAGRNHHWRISFEALLVVLCTFISSSEKWPGPVMIPLLGVSHNYPSFVSLL